MRSTFGDLILSETVETALALASSERLQGQPLQTGRLLAALERVDLRGDWTGIWRNTGSPWELGLADALDRPIAVHEKDPFTARSGEWRGVDLSLALSNALDALSVVAEQRALVPVPPGALARALLSNPHAGATITLLSPGTLTHRELLEIVEEELLGTSLGELDELLGTGVRSAWDPRRSVALSGLQAVGRVVPHTVPRFPALAGPRRDKGPEPGPFTAAPKQRPVVPTDNAWGADLPELPPELRERLVAGTLLRRGTATDPWVIAVGDRVYKVHDLQSLLPEEKQRIWSRAAFGKSFCRIDGVLPSVPILEQDSLLVIEMPLMGPSLQDHLDAATSGTQARLSPEQYAQALARVARTLQKLHERGIVHGQVRPANLLINPDTGWLVLADTSGPGPASSASARRTRRRPALSRYVAPEQYDGEQGPSIDQYALGLTAKDIFLAGGAPPLTTPVHDVLEKAVTSRPPDRFASAAAFGAALVEAIHTEAPRGLADRLAQVRPTRRAAIEPTVLALLGSLIAVLAGIIQEPNTPAMAELEGVLAIGITTWFTWAVVAVAGTAGRWLPFPKIDVLNRRLLTPVVAVGICAGLCLVWDSSDLILYAWYTFSGVYGVRALLAAPPAWAGSGSTALLRLWDRRRLLRRGRRVALHVVTLTSAVGLLASPFVLATVAPADWPTSPVSDFGPLAAVWNFRGGLGNDDRANVCSSVVALPSSSSSVPCADRIHAAAIIQADDPILADEQLVAGKAGTWKTFRAQELPSPAKRRIWRLLAPGDTPIQIGWMYTTPVTQRVEVLMDRRVASAGGSGARSMWLYSVERRGGEWRIVGFRACEIGAPGSGIAPAGCMITESSPAKIVNTIIAAAKRRS